MTNQIVHTTVSTDLEGQLDKPFIFAGANSQILGKRLKEITPYVYMSCTAYKR